MFGSGFDDECWKDGFRDFMRSPRIVSEDTIEAYVGYIENVAAKLDRQCVDLAGSDKKLEETLKRLDGVADWKAKTKSDYKTAIKRLDAYLRLRHGAPGKDVSREDGSVSTDSGRRDSGESEVKCKSKSAGNETDILAQINEIEKMAREHESNVWNSVFKCISAYALGMPSVVIALGVGARGCLLAVVSMAFSFGGAAVLIPVLRRPSRQLKEIQEYGERLYYESKQGGCIHPVEWTSKEKLSGVISAAALLISAACLGLAKAVGS